MVMTFRGYKEDSLRRQDHKVEIEQTEANEVEVISTARWATLDQCGNIYGSPRRGSKKSLMDQDTEDDDTEDDATSDAAVERTPNSPPKAYRIRSGIDEIDNFLHSMELGMSRLPPDPINEKQAEEDEGTMVGENSTISTVDHHHRSYENRRELDDTMTSSVCSSLDSAEKKDGTSLDALKDKSSKGDAPHPATTQDQGDDTAKSGVLAPNETKAEATEERIKTTKKRICKLVILLVAVIVIIVTVLTVRSDSENSASIRFNASNETGSNQPNEDSTNAMDPNIDSSYETSRPDDLDEPVPATDDDYTNPLVTVNPPTPYPSVPDPLMARLQSMYNRIGMDFTPLDPSARDNTPQRRALAWVAQDDQNLDNPTQMTRYALAVLYYSTNAVPTAFEMEPDSWQIVDGWLTQTSYCTWYGIFCDFQGRVESIEMPSNFLTGSLPIELSILGDTLYHIDITDNAIAMSESDYDVFLNLKNLEELYADNNYLESVNGLPTQMASLVNLESLALSFNLLAGDLSSNSVLQSMPLLESLEIESNYLSGSIPYSFGFMSNLEYLFLRHNHFTGDLSFLNAGQMKSLFIMWLDQNQLTGEIPASIETLTDLGSLSLTENRLSGRIPNLPNGLKRLWLYDNQLSGEIPKVLEVLPLEVLQLHNNNLFGKMPKGVCDTFAVVTYEGKSLTSDCNGAVECKPDCCTKCY